MAERDKVFQARLTAEEQRMLKELAALDGVSASDVFRLFIRREHLRRVEKPKEAI
jgi:hypothetical protein